MVNVAKYTIHGYYGTVGTPVESYKHTITLGNPSLAQIFVAGITSVDPCPGEGTNLKIEEQLSNEKKPGRLGYMDVSGNSGTPKSSILIGFSIINHPFWGTPIFGNTHIGDYTTQFYRDYNKPL